MNIVLFELAETDRPLPRDDERAEHLLEILRLREGDSFDAGVIDGPRGKGVLSKIGDSALELAFEWQAEPPPLDPITLVIGLPRPQTARKILNDAAALGVSSIHFVLTDLGDPNYRMSTLWSSGEWRRHLIAGASQAFCTRLPVVTRGRELASEIALAPASSNRIALDNDDAPRRFSEHGIDRSQPTTLAIGAERGWSAAERELLRARGFAFVNLGPRVLRTETACVAALALLKAKLGAM